MTISVKVVADSECGGHRLTTLQLRIPRFILPQFLTHRQFSRNAQSSRAMPIMKMIEQVRKEMVVPVRWGKYQKGMQCHEEITGWRKLVASFIWKFTGHIMCYVALLLYKLQLGKEIANRVLEPWAHTTVLLSSTTWANFFDLRLHHDAQPEIQTLAQQIWRCLQSNTPKKVEQDDWHLPFIQPKELCGEFTHAELVLMSAARCARVSYDQLDGKAPDPARDISLGEFLRNNNHLSPLEHVAIARPDDAVLGNFHGWRQARHMSLEEM